MKARLGIALLLVASLLVPAASHAAWSVDPVTVHATTDVCPLVAAASDAQDGAIVVWQQNDAANPAVFRLLAKRVLANGDVDATWPVAGTLVSDVTVGRTALGALGDGSGGAYVWWMEDVSLYLARVLSDGTLAPGWPARGKSLGTLFTAGFRPLVSADGQGGIWLGWLMQGPSTISGRIAHLGPDGLGVGGWPAAGRAYAISSPAVEGDLVTLAFTFAPAPDGGAWIAWGDGVVQLDGLGTGSWRIKRVTSTGVTASGWDGAGLAVRPYHVELLDPVIGPWFAAAPVAVASDGADGAYLLLTDLVGDAGWTEAQPRLFRLDAAGAPVASWPAAGADPMGWGPYFVEDTGDMCSLRLFPEAGGGVFAMRPRYFTEGYSDLPLVRFTPTGAQSDWGGTSPNGLECIVPPSGETWLATFWPSGPIGPYSPYANLHLQQTSATGAAGPGFSEWHDQPWITWYGDIGLAPTSGGGAIFAWSQVNERHGVFARRFTSNGEVTGVPPADPVARALRLRFAPGRGVVATLGAVAGGRIRLLDVAGRVCGGAEVPAGAREVTLEGTAPLAAGLYFALHRGADGATETGRVLVLR